MRWQGSQIQIAHCYFFGEPAFLKQPQAFDLLPLYLSPTPLSRVGEMLVKIGSQGWQGGGVDMNSQGVVNREFFSMDRKIFHFIHFISFNHTGDIGF